MLSIDAIFTRHLKAGYNIYLQLIWSKATDGGLSGDDLASFVLMKWNALMIIVVIQYICNMYVHYRERGRLTMNEFDKIDSR